MEKLWLVVPCYNEEEVLPETSKRLYKLMADMIVNKKIAPESKIAFVDYQCHICLLIRKHLLLTIVTAISSYRNAFNGICTKNYPNTVDNQPMP